MRTVFFILLLANVAFFAFAWSEASAEANGDAQIVGQQLNREKIRLFTPEQVSALTRKPEPPKVATVCLEWGAFVGAGAARATCSPARPISRCARPIRPWRRS